MRAAVISNPNSRRNRHQLAAVRDVLQRQDGVIHVESQSVDALEGKLAELRRSGVRYLAINGGDGTVQQTLSLMLNGAWPEPPALAILPGGTTNMTAHDLNGGKLAFPKALNAFLDAVARNQAATPRNAVRVRCGNAGPDHYGFFFGMGAILSGIQYCHERVYRLGLSDELAPGFALLRSFYGIARREPVFAEGLPLSLETRTERFDRNVSILCVSALERLFLGMTPFWGTGPGRLAMTLVEERPHALLRCLPALLRGRPDQRMSEANGYYSRRLDALRISGAGDFTLDGEILPATGGRLLVSASKPLSIVPLAVPAAARPA